MRSAPCARHPGVTHTVERGRTQLAYELHGSGPPVIGLHGLTATRRYVVMGSRTLAREGRHLVLYDARGHGASSPAPDGDYSYAALCGDLEAVMDELRVERAVIAGASMGAHTAVRFALERPERVCALAIVTPAFDPEQPAALAHWDGLAP